MRTFKLIALWLYNHPLTRVIAWYASLLSMAAYGVQTLDGKLPPELAGYFYFGLWTVSALLIGYYVGRSRSIIRLDHQEHTAQPTSGQRKGFFA